LHTNKTFIAQYDKHAGVHYFEPDFLGSKPPEKPLKPLTVRMLVESAKAGEWLYD